MDSITKIIPTTQRIRLAAIGGLVGPLLLGGAFLSLSILEYDFMRSLRWHPVDAPAVDWPSGLALGPLGGWMTATFAICGALLMPFGWALAHVLPGRPGQIGGRLMMVAGLGMLGLCFPTDRTYGPGPATLSGRLHDIAYVVLAASFVPALVIMGLAFRRDPRWRGYGLLTLATVLLTGPAFVVKGYLFYGLIVIVIIWCEAVALRLLSLSGDDRQPKAS